VIGLSAKRRRRALRRREEALLRQRLRDLGLKIESSPVEPLVERLAEECRAAGITALSPVCYLSDEWGVPCGDPVIGVPFYLADERVKALAGDVVEGEDEEDALRYLRHEMGHAFNYAYRLHATPAWRKLFGSFARKYSEDYRPRPFDARFVRHLPGFYAQKHPDEDFAETFAVWLTPGSDWRERYRGTPAIRKLQYVDKIVRALGARPPRVCPSPHRDLPVERLAHTLGEHIHRAKGRRARIPASFDGDLRDVFPGWGPTRAADLIWRHEATIVREVARWTGARDGAIRSVIEHLAARAEDLELRGRPAEEARELASIVALTTTLATSFAREGQFVPPVERSRSRRPKAEVLEEAGASFPARTRRPAGKERPRSRAVAAEPGDRPSCGRGRKPPRPRSRSRPRKAVAKRRPLALARRRRSRG